MRIIRPFTQVALFALAVFVCGNTAARASDVPVAKHDVHDIQYPKLGEIDIPTPQRVELDNGLTVFLLEDHSLPQISAIARVGVGSLWEPADMIGLASITGMTMRTGGTASMSSEELNQALANVGATVETGIGEDSGFAYMNTLSDQVDTVLPIFAEVLTQPAFAEDKVKLAKSRTKSGISRRNDNPRGVASREFAQLLYGEDSPYARVEQYYTIDQIDRQALVDFHDKYFHPNNTMLSVWGDFDSKQMIARLHKAFGDWKRAEDFQRPAVPKINAGDDYGVYFIPKSDVTQSVVLMGHVGDILKSDPDYFPVIVMNQVLSGGFSGRMFKNVRSDQGLAYSVFGNYSAGYAHKGAFRAGVGTKSATTVKAANAVLEQIRLMREKPPTAEELTLAKNAFLNSFVFNFDTRREILGRLMTYEYYGYPDDFLQQTKRGVQAVTAADVQRVSQKYLHPDQLDVLVLGKKEDLGQPLTELAKDGKVSEIDISIPTTAPGDAAPKATAADVAAGDALLAKVKDALGGDAFAKVKNFSASSSTVVTTPAGEQTIKSTAVVALPDKFNTQMTLPTGMLLTIIANDGKTILKANGQTMPAPPQLGKQTQSELWHDLTYLMLHANEVKVALADNVTVDGESYRALTVTPPESSAFTLLIDPKTMLPARAQYQAVTRAGPVETESTYADYREVSGIMVPFKALSYQGGEIKGTTTATAFDVNVEPAADLFSTD